MPTTFTTAHYDLQKSTRTNPSRNATAGIAGGEIKYAIVPYTLTSGTDEAADDIIQLCKLPAGATPVPLLSFAYCDADPGTALTVDVGTAANTDGWGDGIAMTAAGIIEFCAAAHTAPAWLVPTPLVADTGTGEAIVYATVVTSTSPVAGVNVYFVLAYRHGG